MTDNEQDRAIAELLNCYEYLLRQRLDDFALLEAIRGALEHAGQLSPDRLTALYRQGQQAGQQEFQRLQSQLEWLRALLPPPGSVH